MKTILAPVDFSDASANALSFAAEMSTRSSAHLHIVNVLAEGGDEAEAMSKLNDVSTTLQNKFGSGLNCRSSVVHGSLVSALQKITEVHRPDVIVMGTHGASGLKKVLIGSNTVNVISKIKLPVFVIPEAARFENFLKKGKNRVVLATDLESLEDENSLDILKEIALLIIESKVRVVSVRPKNSDLEYFKRMEREALLSIFRPEIEADRATVFSSDVLSGINFYLNEHSDSGLIAMIARDSGHLIQKHYTREMASHTSLPLLVLHDAKVA